MVSRLTFFLCLLLTADAFMVCVCRRVSPTVASVVMATRVSTAIDGRSLWLAGRSAVDAGSVVCQKGASQSATVSLATRDLPVTRVRRGKCKMEKSRCQNIFVNMSLFVSHVQSLHVKERWWGSSWSATNQHVRARPRARFPVWIAPDPARLQRPLVFAVASRRAEKGRWFSAATTAPRTPRNSKRLWNVDAPSACCNSAAVSLLGNTILWIPHVNEAVALKCFHTDGHHHCVIFFFLSTFTLTAADLLPRGNTNENGTCVCVFWQRENIL